MKLYVLAWCRRNVCRRYGASGYCCATVMYIVVVVAGLERKAELGPGGTVPCGISFPWQACDVSGAAWIRGIWYVGLHGIVYAWISWGSQAFRCTIAPFSSDVRSTTSSLGRAPWIWVIISIACQCALCVCDPIISEWENARFSTCRCAC